MGLPGATFWTKAYSKAMAFERECQITGRAGQMPDHSEGARALAATEGGGGGGGERAAAGKSGDDDDATTTATTSPHHIHNGKAESRLYVRHDARQARRAYAVNKTSASARAMADVNNRALLHAA